MCEEIEKINEDIALVRQQLTALGLATGAADPEDFFLTPQETRDVLDKWEYKNIYSELTKNNQARVALLRDAVFENKKMTTSEVKRHFSLKHLSNATYVMKKTVQEYPGELELIQIKMNRRTTKMIILKNPGS